MVEYVYALHDFYPEHEDEVSFRAGEPIEVIEKDDLYGDGWWHGRNLSGQVGLFPQSYTTSVPPSVEPLSATDSSAAAASSFISSSSPKAQLQPLREESESGSLQQRTPSSKPSSIHLNGQHTNAGGSKTNVNGNGDITASTNGDIVPSDGEMMKATMTDVQKAIEQLGRSKHDPDGTRSFSFASSRDGDRDTENETETDTDFEIEPGKDGNSGKGENWHKGARRKLAEKARRAVEEAEKLEEIMSGFGSTRNVAPPIAVELSDESEGEDDEQSHPVRKYETERRHSYIPEEDEDAEEDESNHNVKEPVSTVKQRDDLAEAVEVPMRDSTDLLTAKAAQSTFPKSSSTSPQKPVEENQKSKSMQPLSTSVDLDGNNTALPPKPEITAPSHVPNSQTREPVITSSTTTISSVQSRQDSQFASQPLQTNSSQSSPAPPSTTTSTLIGQRDVPKMITTVTSEAEKKENNKRHPSEWTEEEVVEWLKSKGFGQDVCDKFMEQEITGDVLLELDATLLKTEIGIMAFGKRVRIANAIAELRRPPSVAYSDHQQSPRSPIHPNPYAPAIFSPNHSRAVSQATSQSYSYTHTPSMPGSARQSLQGPLNIGTPVYAVLSPESAPHTGDIAGSPALIGFAAAQATNGDYTTGEVEKKTISEGSFGTDEKSVVGLGIVTMGGPDTSDKLLKARPAQLTISPSDTELHRTAQAVSGDGEDDRGVLSEGEAPQAGSTSTTMRRRLFGRSHDSTESGKGKDKRASDPSNSKLKDSFQLSPRTSPSKDVDRDASSVTSRHSRGKKSVDNGKPQDRLSLFGATFSGPLGKSRKPPPRYSGGSGDAVESQTDKGSNMSISRLYGQKKASLRGRNSESSFGDSKDKMKASPTTRAFKAKDTEVTLEKEKDSSVLRKRQSPASPTVTSYGEDGSINPPILEQLKPGQSILDQVGEPDHSGWMRKKGDRYNSWKLRYFILKGPHLYCLKSNSKTETKIKGYVNVLGYKVVADENVNPGRYAFKILHEHDKTHFFSSDEQIVIREWMKAIMKATIGRDYTRPVISSCNIPTIPLMVAQAMNPAPRPPSPGARDATQKALRRENPNQLSNRDARVLMGLPSPSGELKEAERLRLESFFMSEPMLNLNGMDTYQPPVLPPLTLSSPPSPAPPRPTREARKIVSKEEAAPLTAVDRSLIEWSNSYLPSSLRISETRDPLCGGLTLLRLAESIRGRPSSPPVPDSAFPTDPSDDKLDGLFKLFDFLLDNDVKMGAVSINDIRHGRREKILQLLRALKVWEEKRRAVVQSTIGKGPGQPRGFGLDLI